MSADKLDGQFDENLRRALQKYAEPVPADFAEKILKQIRQAEQQRILARVVLQERAALAGCIVLGVITIVLAAVFPKIAGGFIGQMVALATRIIQTIEAASSRWQFYTVFAGVFGFTVYSLVDLLVGDS